MVNITGVLAPALVEFNCSAFLRISRNATHTMCQRACVDHCFNGEPIARLEECIRNIPAACQIEADITHLSLPIQSCASSKGLRLKYAARIVLSDAVRKQASIPYSALERKQTHARFKIMTTGQSECTGEYAICDASFGEDALNSDDCSISQKPANCFALNATRLTENFIAFDDINNVISGSHPFFGGENIDLQIRLASEVFKTPSSCPEFTYDEDILQSKSSAISRERLTVAGQAG